MLKNENPQKVKQINIFLKAIFVKYTKIMNAQFVFHKILYLLQNQEWTKAILALSIIQNYTNNFFLIYSIQFFLLGKNI